MSRPIIAVVTVHDNESETDLIKGLKNLGTPLIVPSVILKRQRLSSRAVSSIKNVHTYDWIIFSSKHAVDFFMTELAHRHTDPPSKKVRIAAVGPHTAQALYRHQLKVHLMPRKYMVNDLVSTLGHRVQGKRILFPRSAVAPYDAVRALRKLGAYVTVISLYTTISKPIPSKFLRPLEKGEATCLIFTSGSGVRGFTKNMRHKGLLRNTPVFCIGPRTATAAKSAGYTQIHTARDHTSKGLIDVVKRFL